MNQHSLNQIHETKPEGGHCKGSLPHQVWQMLDLQKAPSQDSLELQQWISTWLKTTAQIIQEVQYMLLLDD